MKRFILVNRNIRPTQNT